jgi:glycosyltransferase involved in cell wall biosynthesis
VVEPPRPQSELRRLYHAADALALPAEVREGFPLVVQEAVASGLPAVVGDDPGFAPYRGLPNLVFCEQSPQDVREAIRKAVAAGVTLARPGEPPATGFFPALEEWVGRLYSGSCGDPAGVTASRRRAPVTHATR